MDIPVPQEDLARIHRVTSVSDLKSIRIVSCKANSPIEPPDYSNLGAQLEVETEVISEKEDSFIAGVKLIFFSVANKKSKKDSGEPAVKIECEYALTYSLNEKEKIDSKDLSVFCDVNACYNAWPFFREFMLNMTKRMEVPPLTLPFLKIKPKKRRVRKQDPKTKTTKPTQKK